MQNVPKPAYGKTTETRKTEKQEKIWTAIVHSTCYSFLGSTKIYTNRHSFSWVA